MLIRDKLMIPQINENHIELIENGLGLLVKIDDESSELIDIFVERYLSILQLKTDEIFSYQEGVNEIDFNTYSQIYSNYEFSINENEFLFYESQVKELMKESNKEIQNSNNNDINLKQQENLNYNLYDKSSLSNKNLSTLSSKYFKKGTLLWIIKKLDENVFQPLFSKCYKSFIKLFGLEKINSLTKMYYRLINYIFQRIFKYIDTFNKELLNKYFNKETSCINVNFDDKILSFDPTFFKESLQTLQNAITRIFYGDIDKSSEFNGIKNLIYDKNKEVFSIIFNHNNTVFFNQCFALIKNTLLNLDSIDFLNENISFVKVNKQNIEKELENVKKKFISCLIKKCKYLTSLSIDSLTGLEYDSYWNEIEKHTLNYFEIFIKFFDFSNLNKIISKFSKDSNYVNFLKDYHENLNKLLTSKNELNNSNAHDYDKLIISNYSQNFMKMLLTLHKKIIFIGIMFMKDLSSPISLNYIVDKINKEVFVDRIRKNVKEEFKFYLEAKVAESLIDLQSDIVEIQSNLCHYLLSELLISKEDNNNDFVGFRKSTCDICLKLLIFSRYLNLLYPDKITLSKKNTEMYGKDNKKENQIQILMKSLLVKKLSISSLTVINNPMEMMNQFIKISLKNLLESVKLEKFSSGFVNQVKADMYLLKKFIKDYLSNDTEGLIDSFFREINDVLSKWGNTEIDSSVRYFLIAIFGNV